MSISENNQYGTAFEHFPAIGGLMVSKMVPEENIKPRFMYREKPIHPEDSGWRIFTGIETEEYNDNADNIGIYHPAAILQIDPSIQDILLKGIGSAYEKTEDGTQWYKVTDFKLEDDFITTHRLTEDWTIEINHLFERSVEENGDLLYTTGDKSVRLTIWEEENKNRETIYAEYIHVIENRDQSQAATLDKYEFSDNTISRLGYLIQEEDENKSYHVLYGFSMIDNETIQVALYFDQDEDIHWAIETWKNIRFKK